MPAVPYLPIFEITRGEMVESIHFGAIAVVDARDRLLAWYGDPLVVTYLRSSAKPFQALPFLEHQGHRTYHLTPSEIALICASHSGTDAHVAVVTAIQEKTGVQEAELLCGTHEPSDPATAEALRQRGDKPTPNRHNCSGKHTAMLAYARLKADSGNQPASALPYIDPAHPVQKDILKAFSELTSLSEDQVCLGIDGCSAPNFAIPLRNAALAYARLSDPVGLDADRAAACRTIMDAMTAHPEMVGGPDSFDTHLMQAARGQIVCKGGAEGFQALGVRPGVLAEGAPGLGIAFKISDGDLGAHSRPRSSHFGHIRPAVALEILRQLGLVAADAMNRLSDYGPAFTISNWRQLHVGDGHPCFNLQMA